MIAGIVGKVFLNAFQMIAPDIQEDLIMSLYNSSKSFFLGVMLWAFATFSPDVIRNTVRTQFDLINKMVKDANEKIQLVENKMQSTLAISGMKLEFQKIPEGFVPTFDDIQ